jgi:hypothetical protein
MLSRVRGSMTNNNGFRIGCLNLVPPSLQLQPIRTAHNQWLRKTRFILSWAMSVFFSTVADLVLIYKLITYSVSVFHCLTLHGCTLNYWIALWILLQMTEWLSQSRRYVTTDGQSTSLSWNKAPIWDFWPDFYYCQTVAGLLMWCAFSDERMGLSFAISAGPLHHRYSRVRVL